MKKVIFAFILICLCLSNCVYFRMTHLSQEDLGWIQCYSHYPAPTFVSNLENTAKLSYDRVHIYNSTNRFKFSEAGAGDYEANAGYNFEIRQNDTVFTGGLAVKRLINKDGLWARFDLNRLYSKGYVVWHLPLQTRDFMMDSVQYHDCIIADSTNSEYSEVWVNEVKNKMSAFVISKKYGLIYYRFENGEEFKRQFKRKNG